jgi:hypothetical protein
MTNIPQLGALGIREHECFIVEMVPVLTGDARALITTDIGTEGRTVYNYRPS